jgi:conjugal transfer mating pair stabilization protein TraG
VLLLLLTSGRETMIAFKGYAAILIWIQLWPPLYAVLNYMASIYAAYDLAAAADLGTGAKALSLQTASTIYSRAISGEAVVGYLAISIPFIAWAALKRMENFGTALVGGLSGLQGMLAGTTRLCGRWQREHGQRGDGPDAVGAEPHVRVHEQLAERPERQHVLGECADR